MNIFLCYPSENDEEAKQVAAFLRSVGVPYWLDKEALLGGEDWDRRRRDALRQATAVIIMCGNALQDRNGVYHREIHEALKHETDKRLGNIYIIPVRVVDVSLPEELSRFHYIDMFMSEWQGRLAKSLVQVYEQETSPLPPALSVAAATSFDDAPRLQHLEYEDENLTFDAEWPEYAEVGDYWKYINGVIRTPIYDLFYQRQKWVVEGDILSQSSSIHISVSEFFRDGEIVSLTINESFYSGGAHPNHAVTTFNSLGNGIGKLTFYELFSDPSKLSEYLADYVNLDVRRQGYDKFEVREYLYEDTLISMFSEFNLNDLGIRLNLGSNVGLPHVFSGLQVYVPWQNLESYLLDVPKGILLRSRNAS